MRTRTLFHAMGTVAIAASAILAIGASCIVHDTGIVVVKDGFRWCANAEGARGWNEIFAEGQQLLDSDGVVLQGCGCFDDDEHAMLEGWEANGAPVQGDPDFDDYVVLRDEILQAARETCIARADALGWLNNNCLGVLNDGDDLFSNGTSGECHYQEIAVDTDGETKVPPDPNPFDLSGLSCHGGNCRAPRDLIDDMFTRPEAFLLDDARVEIDTDGRLLFTNVSPGDAAYIAGIRSGDKLLSVDGHDVKSLDDLADALTNIRTNASASMTLKDRYGAQVTRSITLF